MIPRRRNSFLLSVWVGSRVTFLLLLASGCGREKMPVQPASDYGSDEEYAVYRTLIADTDFYRAGTVVLVDSTQSWNFLNLDAPWKDRLPDVSDETLQNYLTVNRSRVPMKNISCPGKVCVLISEEEIASWQRRFPGAEGVLTVSSVGFNRAADQALVYRSRYWGPESAAGFIVVLEKKDGRWAVRRSLMIWTS
jgi:hypothetical protein